MEARGSRPEAGGGAGGADDLRSGGEADAERGEDEAAFHARMLADFNAYLDKYGHEVGVLPPPLPLHTAVVPHVGSQGAALDGAVDWGQEDSELEGGATVGPQATVYTQTAQFARQRAATELAEIGRASCRERV